MNLEVTRWLDSEAYAKQREIIVKESNSIFPATKTSAHISFRSPNRIYHVNRSEFKQSPIEKAKAYTAKAAHKKFLRDNGVNPNKHLNIPQNSFVSPIRVTF